MGLIILFLLGISLIIAIVYYFVQKKQKGGDTTKEQTKPIGCTGGILGFVLLLVGLEVLFTVIQPHISDLSNEVGQVERAVSNDARVSYNEYIYYRGICIVAIVIGGISFLTYLITVVGKKETIIVKAQESQKEHEVNQAPQISQYAQERLKSLEEIAMHILKKYFTILFKWKWLLISAPLVSFATVFFISRTLPKTYIVSGKIYPILETRTNRDITGVYNIQPQANHLKNLLNSDFLIIDTIMRVPDFIPEGPFVYDEYKEEEFELLFRKSYKVTEDKDGALIISFQSKNPDTAFHIVNTMIHRLEDHLRFEWDQKEKHLKKVVSDENLLIKEREQKLLEFKGKYGLMRFTDDKKGVIQLYLDLKKQKMADELELKVISSSLNETGNPEQDVKDQRRMRILQSRIKEAGKILKTLDSKHEILYDLSSIQRDLTSHETIYKDLVKEYEMKHFDYYDVFMKFGVLKRPNIPITRVQSRVLVNPMLAFCTCFVICFALVLYVEFKRTVA